MTGYNRWHPTVIASGKITAQSTTEICHSTGTKSVAMITIRAISRIDITKDSQKRRKIFGTSMKKLERSTSFLVAPQVMLYENVCASRACVRWTLNPPKKKKLEQISVRSEGERRNLKTYKKGIQVVFSINASSNDRVPRRYSKRVNPILPAPGKTTVQASQISKECM